MSESGKKSAGRDGQLPDHDPWNDDPSYPRQSHDPATVLPDDPADARLEEVPDTAKWFGGWMICILWVMAMAMATYMANNWLEQRAASRQGTPVANSGGQQGLLLRANRYGQYQVRGLVNGQNMLFLVDTGASEVSIPEGLALKLGLRRGQPYEVTTANGSVTVYRTQLNSLSIGRMEQTNIRAHINPGMEGNVALLGMSFLNVYEIVHKDGEMIIREY